MAALLKDEVIKVARALFMEHGYEAVGMRDIALAVGCHPVQVYRLKLAKSDILAEVIIDLNSRQIRQLPRLLKRVKGDTAYTKTLAYLRALYRLDIQHMPIRSVGAAFGWMWSLDYERRIVEQVRRLIDPIVGWMQEAALDEIPARCLGIWSLYYVGYRHAVIHKGSADDCVAAIAPSLRFFLEPQNAS